MRAVEPGRIIRNEESPPQHIAHLEWLKDFETRNARPLRVLHIGNIANNAYNNAKIQRRYGIQADVICADYYHIMGTPEWEDAEITGQLDAFLPDWWAVSLGDWRRPDWFIQGPAPLCIEYLRRRQLDSRVSARRTRAALIASYWSLLAKQSGRPRVGTPFHGIYKNTSRKLGNFSGSDLTLVDLEISLMSGLRSFFKKTKPLILLLLTMTRKGLAISKNVLYKLLRELKLSFGKIRRTFGRLRSFLPMMHMALPTHRPLLLTMTRKGLAIWKIVSRRLSTKKAKIEMFSEDIILTRTAEFKKTYFEALPDIPEEVRAQDVAYAAALSGKWGDVLDYYDVVQGYALEGLIPLFNGCKVFAAYEHGTLRLIPFEDTMRGRLCRLTYNKAAKVFITNTDVMPSVERLRILADRVVRLPHAFDDEKLINFRARNKRLRPPSPGPPVFFSPTRHHWRSGDDSWLKGNNIFLQAAGNLAKAGRDFRLILIEWGHDLALTKTLIAELGYADRVTWLPQLSKRQLWAAYCQAHAVIDQFAIPAIGGVAFETLALGRRLITRIDGAALRVFFGESPPVLNCATIAEVTERMLEVAEDLEDRAGIGDKGCLWIKKYHSASRIVALQAQAYRSMLEAGPAGVR